jgi:Na+-transporting NADH:ubiquinone oxidoreductase subunit NqrB
MAGQETPSGAYALSARTGELATAAALLAVAGFFVWQAAHLPFGTVRLPGPGFFPFALGIALACVSLAILIRAARGWGGGHAVRLGHRDVVVVLAALLAAAAAFERLGAYATLGLFTAAILLLVARTAPWRAALGAVLGMAAVWLVFSVLLGLRLPAGPF